jgi:hypothetical protein
MQIPDDKLSLEAELVCTAPGRSADGEDECGTILLLKNAGRSAIAGELVAMTIRFPHQSHEYPLNLPDGIRSIRPYQEIRYDPAAMPVPLKKGDGAMIVVCWRDSGKEIARVNVRSS